MKKKIVVKKKKFDLDQLEIDFELVDIVKCECGSEKIYGRNTTHSFWCPKYKK